MLKFVEGKRVWVKSVESGPRESSRVVDEKKERDEEWAPKGGLTS